MVTVLGSNQSAISLGYDSATNLALGQQSAGRINASIIGGQLVTSFDNVSPPTIPAGLAGGFYQTTNGSGGMPPGYTVDVVKVPGNAFVVSSGVNNEIVTPNLETNLQFVAGGSSGSGTVVGGGGISTFTIDKTNIGNWYLASGAGDDLIAAYGSGNDTISAGGGNNSIILGSGANSVLSSGNDIITAPLSGPTGVDTINALTANSTFVRGYSADIYFISGAGGATLIGGTGSDTYFGAANSGSQYIRGGSAGQNYLQAGGGPATLFGGGNGDQLIGQGSVSQTLVAGKGNETLFAGGTGNDSLVVGSGKDVFYGSAGADTFVGGSGQSTVQASLDTNTFEFIRGQSGGQMLVQDLADTNSLKISLTNYQPNEKNYALGHQQVVDGSLTVRLSDGSRITFEDITQKLTGKNFS